MMVLLCFVQDLSVYSPVHCEPVGEHAVINSELNYFWKYAVYSNFICEIYKIENGC